MKTNVNWYKTAIIYEIYPASFTNEGLQGVISKLDYIKNLGANAIWLCPIFASPFKDSGYDTSDYYKINERFGTMADFEELIEKAHQRDLKIILDIALNHTSNEHYWFKEACENRGSKYRDYYIFRDGRKNDCPNNWISSKTLKPTWTYNKATDDYYLHIYTKYQPDLNWRNKKVRQELYAILEYWIDKKVDGFRLDVINKIAKPAEPIDVKSDRKYADYLYENNDDAHKFIKEMRQEVFDKHTGILMMGQTSGVDVEKGIKYGSEANGELDLFLQYDHMDIDGQDKKQVQNAIMNWQNIDRLGAWNTMFFGSHDSSRMINKYSNADKRYAKISAKMLCVLQLCLKGTQVIYMGDELGVINVANTHIDEFIDIRSKDIYSAKIKSGVSSTQAIKELNEITRDNARRQMPWDKAQTLQSDENSVLNFYKKIINWRKDEKTILYGETLSLFDDDINIFAYQRVLGGTTITVLANMSAKEVKLDESMYGELIISNYNDNYENILYPYEAKIYKKQVEYGI